MKALTIWQPYIAGALHGDAWCTRNTLGLRCKDHDFARAFASGVNTICGTALAPKPDERGYWLCRIGNRSGRFDRLRDYAPCDNDELACWLRGLFDSEGNANLTRVRDRESSFYRRIAIYSTNLETLKLAADFLSWLDIPHKIRPTRNSATHRGSKTVFELRILRQDGFERFAAMVGSTICRKSKTMRAIVESYQSPGWQARNWQRAIAGRWPR